MKKEKDINVEKIIAPILLAGGIGILPTDTLYGMVGSALNKNAVERIYSLRERDLKKPMIILISSLGDFKKFGIKLNEKQEEKIKKLWPGKVSVVLDSALKKLEYLHRGGKTLALRFPKDAELLKILKKTGPLVAPTANIAGKKPSQTYAEARKYFGDRVDFYVDNGKLKSKPSTLVKLSENGEIKILRQGAVKIKL
jgi:L-threonylcarbamoyladenylate synthase